MKQKKLLLCIIAALLAFAGCGGDDGVVGPDNGQTTGVDTDTTQESNSLVGTNWKFVGHIDVNSSDTAATSCELPSCNHWAYCEHCFTLSFEADNIVTGWAGVNQTLGKYYADYSTFMLIFEYFYEATWALEACGHVHLYMNKIHNVRTFEFSDETLKLFYNDKQKYLLFERRQ